jgi:rRNA processing protein Krr1/Pno1
MVCTFSELLVKGTTLRVIGWLLGVEYVGTCMHIIVNNSQVIEIENPNERQETKRQLGRFMY